MATADTVRSTRGGEWLIAETDPATVTTPEALSEEHRLIGQTAAEFIEGEVLPVLDRLEAKDWALNRELLRTCAELGLLGTNVPESYGGVDLDKVSTTIVSEQLARSASFAATFGAQANLTILPILLFGTDAQKSKYLPPLVAGELVGAYCLSESGSGSDALGAKARAERQSDGSFLLSGEKMWITNGGFADVYIVFAKVDGEQFTAFIVERAWPGVTAGKEEHKLGLHGSSTTPVILQDVKVPADAVLGEIGKGHKVAFNVLKGGAGRCRPVRGHPQAVRRADRHLRRHPPQARRDDGPRVRAREPDVSHRRADRSTHRRQRRRRRRDAAGAGGVLGRGVDRQGLR
jgi:alkylation response protein AidB-like acyl-CoA dehydrogenase